MLNEILIALGSGLAGAFSKWVFDRHRRKADTQSVEQSNSRAEIENLKLIVQEWREAASQWKDMADDYQQKFIDNSRKLDEVHQELRSLKSQLAKANRRIKQLEEHDTKN
jgi:uncharacterized coiled-coil DUF342 family protein